MPIFGMSLLLWLGSLLPAHAADNGLGLTPAMGWSTWNLVQQHINETFIHEIADAMADNGYLDAGYEYLCVDDGWACGRDASGLILECKDSFPSGMAALADYVHSRGLKFGIYTAWGDQTCQNRPGSYGFEEKDVRTYAKWGVDYVKVDSCGPVGPGSIFSRYERYAIAANRTGRPMYLSLTPQMWSSAAAPTHDPDQSLYNETFSPPNASMQCFDGAFTIIPSHDNGQDFGTIANDWFVEYCNNGPYFGSTGSAGGSLLNILDAQPHLTRHEFARRGAWNFMDILMSCAHPESLNLTESVSEFSLWAVLASPLILGTDMREKNSCNDALLNPEVIAVNQDPDADPFGVLAWQSSTTMQDNMQQIFVRELDFSGDAPRVTTAGAAVLFNRAPSAANVTLRWDIFPGMPKTAGLRCRVRDLWARKDVGESVADLVTMEVPSHGVVMLRVDSCAPPAPETPSTTSNTALPEHLPRLKPPTQLLVVTIDPSSPDRIAFNSNESIARTEVGMLESLAGLMLRYEVGTTFYFINNIDGKKILDDLVSRRDVTYTMVSNTTDPWELAANVTRKYLPRVKEFVTYDLQNWQSNNVARMGASKYSALMVARVMRTRAEAVGFKLAEDLGDRDDLWSLENWFPTWNMSRMVAVENAGDVNNIVFECLNDVATAFGTLAFGAEQRDGSQANPGPYRDRWLAALPEGAIVVGWPHYQEIYSIPDVSRHNKLYLVAELSKNLALLSTFRRPDTAPPSRQSVRRRSPAEVQQSAGKPKHYATFQFTDGDNIEWLDGEHLSFEFYSQGRYWDAPERGLVPVSWGMLVGLAESSATVQEMLYDQATPLDNFVAVSPVYYGYVSNFSAEFRAKNAVELAERMRLLDMDTINFIDYKYSDYADKNETWQEVYRPYANESQIKSIWLYPFDTAYEGNGTVKGSIQWLEGTPIITGRALMDVGYVPCQDTPTPSGSANCRTVEQIAHILNEQKVDPTSSAGYSLIPISVFSTYNGTGSMASIAQVMSLLEDHVEVVTGAEFNRLILENVERV